MKPDNHAANGPNFDPLFTAVQQYTMRVALVGILVTLIVIGWVVTF
jgi:hypothetical protein